MAPPRKWTPEERRQNNRDAARRHYEADPAAAKAASRAWAKANPEKRKQITAKSYRARMETTLFYRYGIGVAEYEELLVAQRGLCAACGNRPRGKRLSVDHHHGSGRVRGLLHANCNTLLGLAGDDPAVLMAAAAYLTGAA